MALKRSREELLTVAVEKLAMVNCVDIMKRNESLGQRKLYECKTCKKQFVSFQALGGHRTSHKNKLNSLPVIKMKKHECSLCGEEFALGQALGGHMRKHRDELNQKKKKLKSDEPLHNKGDLGSTRTTLFLDLNLTPCENELITRNIPT